MQKTSVYIPKDVKHALGCLAAERVDEALLDQRHFRAMPIERRRRFKVLPFDR